MSQSVHFNEYEAFHILMWVPAVNPQRVHDLRDRQLDDPLCYTLMGGLSVVDVLVARVIEDGSVWAISPRTCLATQFQEADAACAAIMMGFRP